MNVKSILVLLLLVGFSCAIILSGDAGEEWSKNKSEEMCARYDVAAVYICLGNTVDVVWKDASKGSTFYRPDGRDVECPPVEPTEMGAECMQVMMPNYCTLDDNVCGAVAPEEFPGGETEGEIIYEGTPQPPAETPPTQQPPAQQPPEQGGVVITGPQVGAGTGAATTTTEGTLSNLVILVFALAVIALIVLYFVFRRTTGR